MELAEGVTKNFKRTYVLKQVELKNINIKKQNLRKIIS